MTVAQLINDLKASGGWDYIWNCFIVNSEKSYHDCMNFEVKRYDYDLNDAVPVLLIWLKSPRKASA